MLKKIALTIFAVAVLAAAVHLLTHERVVVQDGVPFIPPCNNRHC